MSRWPRLMKRETLAEYIDRSTDYVDGLKKAGKISYVPGTTLYDRCVIDKWLDGLSGLANSSSQSRFSERLGDGQGAH